jgi:hypothetical protein
MSYGLFLCLFLVSRMARPKEPERPRAGNRKSGIELRQVASTKSTEGNIPVMPG